MCVKDSGEDRWIPSGQVATLPFSVENFSFSAVRQYMAEQEWLNEGWTLLKGRKLLSECLQFFERWVTEKNPLVVFDKRGNPLLARRVGGNIVVEKTDVIPPNTWTVLFKKRPSKKLYSSGA